MKYVDSGLRFFSRSGLDRFLFEQFFYGRRNGVFVDIGAGDGERSSNTLFFERTLGWRGLCVEGNPSLFTRLARRRAVVCEQALVASGDGRAATGDGPAPTGPRRRLARLFDRRGSGATGPSPERRVTTLSSLLERHGFTTVDYCAMSAAGAEFDALRGLDFDRFSVSLFTIRNVDDERIADLMEEKGFRLVGTLGEERVFARGDLHRLPQTTVICAVWNRDPDRLDRLRGHAANLARQTVPIEAIYVFDGGDAPPPWLAAKSIAVRHPLTIYQAWNLALSAVETPLVMNLNLDDRLACDAVELLQDALARENACLVGGDWKICYAQAETDDIGASYPADRLPFVEGWPLPNGTVARLGSGTGESGSYGPAVLWRMDAHVGRPRFPWRFNDGTPIRIAGDSAWWKILRARSDRKTARLPMVIGHYHSHPGDQAEFRAVGHDELALMKDVGVSPL